MFAPVREMLTHKLLIPQNGIGAESLNVSIATAIILSEFRRRPTPASMVFAPPSVPPFPGGQKPKWRE